MDIYRSIWFRWIASLSDVACFLNSRKEDGKRDGGGGEAYYI